MAAAAETLAAPEITDRRTDDILFNVYYLQQHIVDKQQRIFNPIAENDVLEQNISDVAEADIHKYGTVVHQKWDRRQGQYVSLGSGTVRNAVKGLRALDPDDAPAGFELFRRVDEVAEEEYILWPDVQTGMRKGGKKVFISPAPTHHEVDPDVAESFGYDDRTMFRIQDLSPDGSDKTMVSFSVFDVPAKAWADFLNDRYEAQIEPTAQAVMEFCHQLPLEFMSRQEVLEAFISGVIPYLAEADRPKVQKQLEAFLYEQQQLEAQANYYGTEKLAIQKELACCLGDWASPTIERLIRNVEPSLSPEQQVLFSKNRVDGRLSVTKELAELVMQIKTVTTNNRAGLATENERTVLRAAARMGSEAVLALIFQEQALRQLPEGLNNFLSLRNDQVIAQAGLSCGGGCSVEVIGIFSADAKEAREAGLTGTLYKWSKEESKNSKCGCPNKSDAEVISNGKDAYCKTCKQGSKGNSEKITAKAA